MIRMAFFLVVISLVSTSADSIAVPSGKSGWKVLKNRFGWSIQHPADWESDELGGVTADMDDAPPLCGPEKEEKTHQQFGCVVIQAVSSMFEKLTPKEYVEGINKTSPGEPKNSLLNGHGVKIAGISGYEVTIQEGVRKGEIESTFHRLVAVKKNKQLITLKYGESDGKVGLPKSKWKYEKIFDEMLSTFKFTK